MKNWYIKVLVFSFSLLTFFGCKNNYLLKGMGDTYLKLRLFPNISGYSIYNNRVVNSGTPQRWDTAKNYNKLRVAHSFAEYLKKKKTAAYLIIRNDSIC